MPEWRGTFTALVTPFRPDGSIDEEPLRRFVEFQVEGGVEGVIVGGTTGEGVTLEVVELLRLIDVVLETVDGRAVVLGAASGNATERAAALAATVGSTGVDGVMSVVPFYNRPTQRGIVEHFSRVAELAGVPVMLYNVPSRTGANALPSTVLELMERGAIVGVKEASGNVMQAMEIIRHRSPGFSVMSGEDVLGLPIVAAGGQGVVSVASNEIPEIISRMIRHALDGDMTAARALHYSALDLMNVNFVETNPIPVKAALSMMGLMDEHYRAPLVPPTDETRDMVRACLTDLGLVVRPVSS